MDTTNNIIDLFNFDSTDTKTGMDACFVAFDKNGWVLKLISGNIAYMDIFLYAWREVLLG